MGAAPPRRRRRGAPQWSGLDYDAQVFWDPALRPSSSHGVTMVVAGNCGFTIAPTRPEHHEVIARTLENVEDMDGASLIPWDFETYPEYLASIRRRGTVLNFTTLTARHPRAAARHVAGDRLTALPVTRA